MLYEELVVFRIVFHMGNLQPQSGLNPIAEGIAIGPDFNDWTT